MNVTEMRNRLSVRGKNGLAFLLAACLVWLLYTLLFMLKIDLFYKNVGALVFSGLLFPMALLFSKAIKADWKHADHPLGKLGLILNAAQFMYFPFLLWALIHSPNDFIVFYAVIGGAHFFPYGWFYRATAYYVMAPVMSIVSMAVGWTVHPNHLWLLPFSFAILLIILMVWLYADYKNK